MQTTKRRGRPRGKRRDESDSDEEYNALRDEFNSVIDSAHQWILPAMRERRRNRAAIEDAIAHCTFNEQQWDEEQERINNLWAGSIRKNMKVQM